MRIFPPPAAAAAAAASPLASLLLLLLLRLRFTVRRISDTASMRRVGVDRWCTTAIEIAKSKNESLCGRQRMSATTAEWGWWFKAMRARFSDLGCCSVSSTQGAIELNLNWSEATGEVK